MTTAGALLPPPICVAGSTVHDVLDHADEPLAGLQRACGGTLPGPIAIPALADLVRQARGLGLRLARAIVADDGEAAIHAWVEIDPNADDGGCRIVVRSWQAEPHGDAAAHAGRYRNEIDRALAEITAQLDAAQAILTVEGDAADVRGAVQALRAGIGRPWTDVITVAGGDHRQPLHWRLLDGAHVTVPGSARGWRAVLLPLGGRGVDVAPSGFELLLVSDTPPALRPTPRPAEAPTRPMIGREVAPVLRQPIARIIANAETIRARLAGPLADDYSRYAGDIAHAGQHLLELVDDLADLEMIEGLEFVTAADAIDLVDVARRAGGILGMRARERGIALDLSAADRTVGATAEFRRVLQILINLIGNAIRYSPENTRIVVTADASGDMARIVVADEGLGLAADQQARVFEKFERLGRSGDGGTGLGLYISRRLARAMGGDLAVESEPGQGARFILTLPAGH